uniref:Uncharacterized protein n=1 Tax=Mola mola TaxID=94237 RepID=A0A3Q3VTV4_MOLML
MCMFLLSSNVCCIPLLSSLLFNSLRGINSLRLCSPVRLHSGCRLACLTNAAETHGPVYRVNVLHWVLIYITRNGLVTALNHEQWYKQRRIMDLAFSSVYLRGLMGTFNERAETLMEKLFYYFANNKKEAKMLHLVNCVTLDVIAKVAFGVDLDMLNKSSPFPKAIETCLKGLVYFIRDFFFAFNPKNWPFISEVKEACRFLRETGAQWIQDRKTAMRNGNIPQGHPYPDHHICWQRLRMTKEDEEFMLDNFVTFFIAGQETTANLIALCIMQLAKHPDVLEKLKKELDEVIGMKQDLSYDDLGQLVYLSQVLKETLRLYPPVPVTSRELKEDIVIDGIHIPGGVIGFFSSYVCGRMDKFFRDPLTFDPDRFHPDAPRPYYCYYPFALGPRSCLGQNFAQVGAMSRGHAARSDGTLTGT